MGWKNVKEHYRIGHIVHVLDECVCIGSAFCPELIKIGMDAKMVKALNTSINDDLNRYMDEMKADRKTLKRLINEPDTFSRSLTIWTYDGGDIIEKQCESPEWPNVTHDGQMIYDNTHSTNRWLVIQWAKENAQARKVRMREMISEAKERLAECERMAAEAEEDARKLIDTPDTTPDM